MVRVVLISLYNYESFGIRAIHSFLKKKGVDVHIIFFKKLMFNNMIYPTEKEFKLLLSKLEELNPTIIGISISSPFFIIAKNLIEMIKRKLNVTIILGGIHATICPEECIKYADIVCIGEGEYPMLELIHKIEKNQKYDRIQNLWVKTNCGVIKNNIRFLIQELDSLPLFDYDESDKYFIENNVLEPTDPTLFRTTYDIMASRGCPFQCNYCVNNVLKTIFKDKGAYTRRRSVKHVINELSCAKKTFKNIKRIFFLDEVFVLDKQWLRKFVKEYGKKIKLPFGCEFYPTTVDEENISILKEVGLDNVTIGIQSGSERTRNHIYERFTPTKDIIKAMKILKKYRIFASYDIILDNPLENEVDLKETFELCMRIPKPFNLHLYSLVNFPKTKLTKMLTCKSTPRKALTQWRMSLGYGREKKVLYWNALISLTGLNFVPRKLIRILNKIEIFKIYPKFLVHFYRVFNALEVFTKGVKLLIKREISLVSLFSKSKLFLIKR